MTKQEIKNWRKKTIEIRNNALYQQNSNLLEVISAYVDELMESDKLHDLVHAKALQRYRDEIINKQFLSRLRKNFNEIYKFIDTNLNQTGFFIDGRRKSFISADNKILDTIQEILLLQENSSDEFTKLLKELENNSLIKDTYAIRIVLFDATIEDLYSLYDSVISFFESKGAKVCKKKDFVKKPKSNGYTSLHVIIKSKTGEYFEIQFRTFDMHITSETGPASHIKYKPKDTSFDGKLVNINGYKFVEVLMKEKDEKGNEIEKFEIFEMDAVGVSQSVNILRRQKTF